MHDRELSRIETGSKIPSKTQLDALFQRLGLSADRIEGTLSYKEYQLCLLRKQIEWSIIKNEFDLSSNLIMLYKDKTDSNDPLEEQYILFMKTIVSLAYAQVGTLNDVSEDQNLCYFRRKYKRSKKSNSHDIS